MKKIIFLVIIGLNFSLSPAANAIVINLDATLDGAQANAGAGTGSPGTGSAILNFETATNLLSWTVDWQDLIGSVSAAHFHGPALPNQNAGVQVGIDINFNPTVGNAALSAAQAGDLLAGLWYVNIHTTPFPGGEIRGQIGVTPSRVPEPSTLALLGLSLVAMGVMRRRRTVLVL